MIELIKIRGLRVPPPPTSLATLQCIMWNWSTLVGLC